jgi:hypothetical protein
MTTLKIEAHTAERLVARILRDDLKLQPDKANKIASTICSGISAAMPDPLRAGFGAGWRAIERHPPRGEITGIVAKLRRKIPQADEETIDDVWRTIYEYGQEIPDADMA